MAKVRRSSEDSYTAASFGATTDKYFPDSNGVDVSNYSRVVFEVYATAQSLALQVQELLEDNATWVDLVGYAVAATTTGKMETIDFDKPARKVRLKMTSGGTAPTLTQVGMKVRP